MKLLTLMEECHNISSEFDAWIFVLFIFIYGITLGMVIAWFLGWVELKKTKEEKK